VRFNRSSFAVALVTVSLPVAFWGCSKDEPASFTEHAGTETEMLGHVDQKVIYGEDNRHEYFAEPDADVRALSESTVALIKNAQIGPETDGRHAVRGDNFGSSYGLCSTERFAEQETAAFCSGFLIAPNLIATAGHCVRSALDCSETSFVFDYAYKAAGVAPTSAAAENVYRCKSVVHTEAAPAGADFAIVELDRPVMNRAPLTLRHSGELQVGDDLTVIGHPAGLPTKISDGAKARNVSPSDYFVANLDTYGGNSGSAVFNTKTKEVEGILVRGETDFVWSPKGCSVSYVCKNDGCRGEDVTKISSLFKILDQL
jgi:V8-like Glu-specific endopeptidase